MPTPGLTAELETWDQVRKNTKFTGILVGNGASRAVWDRFAYESLFRIATSSKMTNRLSNLDLALFEKLNTRNFEQVLESLNTARLVAAALEMDLPVLNDRYTGIQNALIEAVKGTHIPWVDVPSTVLGSIRKELLNYKSVYSTNYDLLIYWAMMSQKQGGSFKDYFWNGYFDLGNAEVYGCQTVVLYLHGGLHLYRTLTARTFKRRNEFGTNLLDLFAKPFAEDEEEDASPLFISEGSATDKLASIRRSDYLSFAYTKLTHHQGHLCVFGHSLSGSDDHIVQALKRVRKGDQIAISVFPGSPNEVIAAKANAFEKLPSASLRFYDSSTHPLGAAGLKIRL